jgi:hypothetical protein
MKSITDIVTNVRAHENTNATTIDAIVRVVAWIKVPSLSDIPI